MLLQRNIDTQYGTRPNEVAPEWNSIRYLSMKKDSEIVPVKFMCSLASFVFAQWLSFGCDPQARES